MKLYTLYQFLKKSIRCQGDIAELGVYRGGSAKLMAMVSNEGAPDKKVLLCDTFKGMPSSDNEQDVFKKSDLSDTDFAEVRRYLSDCPNVVFYEGIFSKTFPTIPNRLFSFVHVDCDLHLSVLECCEFFYPKMAPGGVILFDDYGFLCAPGAKKAVDAFFSDKPEYPVALSTGQCIVVKS